MSHNHPIRLPTAPAEYNDSFFNTTLHTIWLWMHAAGQPHLGEITDEAIRTTTATTVLVGRADGVVLVDTTGGNVAVTLPAPLSVNGGEFTIKRITAGANTLIVTPSTGNIDNAASKAIPTQYDAFTFKSDGVGYWIV